MIANGTTVTQLGQKISTAISTDADFGTLEAGVVIRTQIITLLDQSA